MRIHMQSLASLFEQDKGHLATAVKAATHPSPPLINPWSPQPEPPQPQAVESESVTWLRATIEGDRATAEAVRDATLVDMGANYVGDYYSEQAAAYIRRHDPRDTIARCEAETKLLDLHGPNRYGQCRACDPESCGCTGSEDYPCATVRTILSGYRHRPGFKPEWVSG